MTQFVTSKDGTQIAFDKVGSGPGLILVSGALGYRPHMMFSSLVPLLSPHFTVIDYDRRGRGESGDNQPYAAEREIEDIEALIDALGEPVYLYGSSSGAALALEVISKMPHKVKKAVLHEPPFIIDNTHPAVPDDYVDQIRRAVTTGQPGDAVEIFMTVALRIPAEYVAGMKMAPTWGMMAQVEHTLAYDAAVMGDRQKGNPLPTDRWTTATVPILVAAGTQTEQFIQNSAPKLAEILPDAGFKSIEGQGHGIESPAIAPILIEYFG